MKRRKNSSAGDLTGGGETRLRDRLDYAWLNQARAFIRQGGKLNDFILHASPAGGARAIKAYKIAAAEVGRRSNPTGADLTATIKPGFGYWDVTRYPRGGDFRRATTPIDLTQVRVVETYKDGSPKEIVGKTVDGRTLCVGTQCLIAKTNPVSRRRENPIKAFQLIETAKDKTEAEMMLAGLGEQVNFIGGRILAPSPVNPKYRMQAFFRDEPDVTDQGAKTVGLRRVLILNSQRKALGLPNPAAFSKPRREKNRETRRNPAKAIRLRSGKVRVREGKRVLAWATTKKRGARQIRLLRGIRAGWKPKPGVPARDVRAKLATLGNVTMAFRRGNRWTVARGNVKGRRLAVLAKNLTAAQLRQWQRGHGYTVKTL